MQNEFTAIEESFWQDLHDVSLEVDQWPEWKRSYRIDIYSERIQEQNAVSTADPEKSPR